MKVHLFNDKIMGVNNSSLKKQPIVESNSHFINSSKSAFIGVQVLVSNTSLYGLNFWLSSIRRTFCTPIGGVKQHALVKV